MLTKLRALLSDRSTTVWLAQHAGTAGQHFGSHRPLKPNLSNKSLPAQNPTYMPPQACCWQQPAGKTDQQQMSLKHSTHPSAPSSRLFVQGTPHSNVIFELLQPLNLRHSCPLPLQPPLKHLLQEHPTLITRCWALCCQLSSLGIP